MARKFIFIFVILFMSVCMWASPGSAQIKEGLWEITTKSEMKGLPMQIPPTITKQCITKKEPFPMPDKQEKGQECKIKEQKISSDTVTYAMECKDKTGAVVTTSGKSTYKGNTFNGTTDITMKSKEQGTIHMKNTMSGKYIGPCPK